MSVFLSPPCYIGHQLVAADGAQDEWKGEIGGHGCTGMEDEEEADMGDAGE